jgi:transcriptional regulator with XRE-family HTH domain
MGKKAPNPIDTYVGSRVRMRRMMLGMSQQTVAGQFGRTFQQLQKYEKGTNRISASRLQQIGNILQVPVSFFFEGSQPQADMLAGTPLDDPFVILGSTRDGLALARAFNAIPDAKVRAGAVALIESIAALCSRDFAKRAA